MESISTKNYKINRSTLKRVNDSGIDIDWDLPGDKEVSAFGLKINTMKPQLVDLYEKLIITDDITNLSMKNVETLEALSNIPLFQAKVR